MKKTLIAGTQTDFEAFACSTVLDVAEVSPPKYEWSHEAFAHCLQHLPKCRDQPGFILMNLQVHQGLTLGTSKYTIKSLYFPNFVL